MSNQLSTQSQDTTGITVGGGSPSQSLQTSESSRALGEIQAMLTVAAARPRDEIRSIERINNACLRQRLAEQAEYVYSKGGQQINGATIRLLEVIGQNWGNMTWGFRELSQIPGKESTVQAYAWDLETNVKITRDFVVPHGIKARGSIKMLTDPREIYELIANQAQRRVRTCLENCIPRDIIEDAVDKCRKTVTEKCELTPERIKDMGDKFKEKFGVRKVQIEMRIQRKIESIQPAQFLALIRIFKSLDDGMSVVGDWFQVIEDDNSEGISNIDQLTDRLAGGESKTKSKTKPKPKTETKSKAKKKTESEKPEKPVDDKKESETTVELEGLSEGDCRSKFSECGSPEEVNSMADDLISKGADAQMVDHIAGEALQELAAD